MNTQRLKKVGPILLAVGLVIYFALGTGLSQFGLGLAVVGAIATAIGFFKK
jgi:hypothetical protein